MPIHDWTRVAAGTFHDFHQGWTIGIRNGLNSVVLPDGYSPGWSHSGCQASSSI